MFLSPTLVEEDISPGDGFTRLDVSSRTNIRGLPENIHTGGIWVSPEGEYWKPLDARPYRNATKRFPTDEAACLSAMVGRPFFPCNWRIAESVDGRRWLVRHQAQVYGHDLPKEAITEGTALAVEQAIRDLNRQDWELGDDISLALDENGEMFILDLSAAICRQGSVGIYAADDSQRVIRFFRWLGFDHLCSLREAGRTLAVNLWLSGDDAINCCKHVYLTPCEHSNDASLPVGGYFVPTTMPAANDQTWVVSASPLLNPDQYGLIWAWSPIKA